MYAVVREPKEVSSETRTRTVFHLLGIIALLGWLFVLFASDLFTITTIEARGLKALDPVDVSREVYAILDARTSWRPWSTRHSWFIDKKQLEEELRKRLFATKVIVDNSRFYILRLLVEERSNKLILHSGNQFIWVDLQGIATGELNANDLSRVRAILIGQQFMDPNDPPIVHKDLDELVGIGYSVTNNEQMKKWITIASELAKQGLPYREIDPPKEGSSALRLISAEGYPVLIDYEDPLEPQIKTYNVFKKTNPKGVKVSEYIDVRIPGRVYIK